MRSIGVLAPLAALGVLLSLCSCSRSDDGVAEELEQGEGESSVSVAVTAVRRGPISRFIPSAGNLEAEREAMLLAETSGRVEAVAFEEGDAVPAGALLVTLDDDDPRLQVARARLVAERDAAELARITRLHERELVAGERFEAARLQAELSATDLELAKERLDRTRVRAPFEGVLAALSIRPGQSATAGAPVARVVVLDPLLLRIHLPEDEVAELRIGQPVEILAGRASGGRHEGEIRLISPVVDPSAGTVEVTIEVPNPELALRPGSFARVRVVTEVRDAVLLVPTDALLFDPGESFVFRVEGDSVTRAGVEIGLAADGWTEVRRGLDEGDAVVSAGQGALRRGDRVSVVDGEDEEAGALAAEREDGNAAL